MLKRKQVGAAVTLTAMAAAFSVAPPSYAGFWGCGSGSANNCYVGPLNGNPGGWCNSDQQSGTTYHTAGTCMQYHT